MRRTLYITLGLLTIAWTANASIFDWVSNLFTPTERLGASVIQSTQGGTGTSTPPGNDSILLGNADKTYNVKTLTAGANITFTETGNSLTIVGSAGGSGDPFAWTPTDYGNATSTTLGFLNGFISSGASSTISDSLYITSLLNCDTIDTDAFGLLSCGTDASGGAGTPNLVYKLFSGTKYFTASSSDALPFRFADGFVSSGASSTISDALKLTGGLTLTCTGCITDTNVDDNITLTNITQITNRAITDTTGTLTATRGGTGQSTWTAGDIVYSSAADTLTKLNAGTRGKILSITTGGIPGWISTSTMPFLGSTASAGGDLTGNYPNPTIAVNSVDGTNLQFGSDATGDSYYYNGTDVVRLGVGTRGTLWGVTTGGVPGWVSTSTFAHLNVANAFTNTGTTTFAGGIYVNDIKTNLPNCNSLDTDASGAIVCGTDETGGGGGTNDWQVLTINSQKYLTPTTTNYNLLLQGTNGLITHASSTIGGNLNIGGVLNASSTAHITGDTTLGGTLKVTGSITPTINNTYTLGTSVLKFVNVYGTNINTILVTNTLSSGSSLTIREGNTNQYVVLDGETGVKFQVNSTDKAILDSTGYLGIGTTSPGTLLALGNTTTFINLDNTGTSTFSGGIYANALRTNLPNCNSLDTDASGALICGTDETGGAGVPNLIYRTLGTTKFYTASSSATDNNVFHFNNGFVSSASSSIAGNLRLDGTLLGAGTFTLTGSGTSTLSNGLSAGIGGLASSKGISLTGGIFNSTVTSTSTFSGGLKLGVSAGGLSIGSNRLNIFNNGNILFGTSTVASTATTSPQVLIATPFVVDTGHNGTTTIQMGDVGSPVCGKWRDKDNGGWTYITVIDGTIRASTVSCE